MDDQTRAVVSVAEKKDDEAEEDGALRKQLAGLEAQREQLASLLGDDPQGPLLQLQVCMYVCMCVACYIPCSLLMLVSSWIGTQVYEPGSYRLPGIPVFAIQLV